MSKQGAKNGHRLTKEQKGEIIRMIYAGVPRQVIMEKCNVSDSTVYRLEKQVSSEMAPAKKSKSDGRKSRARVPDKAPSDGESDEVTERVTGSLSRDELASYALQGMRENLSNLLASTIPELKSLDGTERIYAEVAVRKEVRMTLTQLGKWGGLENFVEHDNPVLADFARAMDSKKDDEDPEGWEVTE